MSDFDEIPKDLEAEYNKIINPDTKGKPNRVDEAYQIPEEDLEQNEDVKDPTKEVEESEVEEPEVKEQEEVESEEEPEKEEKPEAEADEGEEEDIPEDLVLAGRTAGLSDKKIIELAENHPEVLEVLAEQRKQILAASVQSEPEPEPKVKEPEKPERLGKLSLSDLKLGEDVDESTKSALQKIVERTNVIVDKHNAQSEELAGIRQQNLTAAEKQQIDYDNRVDGFFDSVEDCPVGKSKTLTEAQLNARLEIHEIAKALSRGGGTLEQCLEKAVKAYNGMYGSSESDAETNLRRKLNKTKKKFSPRPGGQKTAKKFRNEQEEVMDAFDSKAQELGIEFSDG